MKAPTETWRSCEALLDRLDLPEPFTVQGMVEVVQRHIGGRIQIREVELDVDAPCGLWLAVGELHLVFVDARSPVHRDHIVLHELAHMICGHGSDPSDLARLFPDIDPERVRAALARTSYTDDQEREAETLATILAGRGLAGRSFRPKDRTGPASAVERTLR